MEDIKKVILIQIVKRKCYITDNSDLIKNRLEDIIDDAIIKITEMIGIKDNNFDFSQAGPERDLLKNYCFYVWNDKSIKEFEDNYISDILKLRHKYIVEYADKESETSINND